MDQRIGFGYDSHQFGGKGPVILAGVRIKHDSGLKGHSDADAVAHAITDALLGAAAMGDIGGLFPDTDKKWKGADSLNMLAEVKRRVVAAGYRIINVDATVIAEAPKIGPHVKEMRENLARVLAISEGAISVKGKTNEKMDDAGAGKGIMVHAVASLGGA
jgi:2-C-methyl-D-erythritol 2,4-cyclodiphosphate synthase